MNAVVARALEHRYSGRTALPKLDLDVEPRARLAVLGGNGSGKTTLLRILATAIRPTAGTVALFGLDAARERARCRQVLGYLGHAPGLYPELTVVENLEFFRTLYGAPREAVPALVRAVGLERRASQRARSLSRGEQQRVALARSLIHDPRLWILDEPDTSLDEEGRNLIAELAKGRTLVLATHDRRLAAGLGAESLVLGETPRSGPSLEVAG